MSTTLPPIATTRNHSQYCAVRSDKQTEYRRRCNFFTFESFRREVSNCLLLNYSTVQSMFAFKTQNSLTCDRSHHVSNSFGRALCQSSWTSSEKQPSAHRNKTVCIHSMMADLSIAGNGSSIINVLLESLSDTLPLLSSRPDRSTASSCWNDISGVQ